MTRKTFSQRDVIASLVYQGCVITCYRTGERITLENVKRLEREHLVELGLITDPTERRKYDTPEYCRYSLKEAHALITNGNGATSAGSSKHRVAKAVRLEKTRLEELSGQTDKPKRRAFAKGAGSLRGRNVWPEGRKIQGRGFQKRPEAST